MDELSFDAFERRAEEAEARLARLEKKVASKSGGAQDLRALYATLSSVRQTLGKERVRCLKLEGDNAKLEGEKGRLEGEVGKLRYQVLHLTRALEQR